MLVQDYTNMKSSILAGAILRWCSIEVVVTSVAWLQSMTLYCNLVDVAD